MMVRLIVNLSAARAADILVFQFHDGAIDSVDVRVYDDYGHSFQFHDGAIDRVWRTARAMERLWFQFHDGAIDRRV